MKGYLVFVESRCGLDGSELHLRLVVVEDERGAVPQGVEGMDDAAKGTEQSVDSNHSMFSGADALENVGDGEHRDAVAEDKTGLCWRMR